MNKKPINQKIAYTIIAISTLMLLSCLFWVIQESIRLENEYKMKVQLLQKQCDDLNGRLIITKKNITKSNIICVEQKSILLEDKI